MSKAIILITSIGCAPASAIARTLNQNKDYYIIGIDIQKECVGNFITDKYLQSPIITDPQYWHFIYELIKNYNITHIFPTYNSEIYEWSIKKNDILKKYKCKVFVNDTSLVKIADDKLATYKWCIDNNIQVPNKKDILDRPIIIKPLTGCGAVGHHVLKTYEDKYMEPRAKDTIIQEFISGKEYTVDVLSSPDGKIISIIPKERVLIKNGQSFKSITRNNKKVIDFVANISKKLENRSIMNVQVIQDNEENLYLIEINPRWPTTISLSINAGVNMPSLLIEEDYLPKLFTNNLMMIRDYKEYFILDE
jgi:carbamoyl-phosphate synthase large subunit